MQHRRSVMAALGLLCLTSAASAGVVDSPLPAPFTKHVFTVPGLASIGNLRHFFSCTNLDSVSVTIGVEHFGSLGGGPCNDVVADSLSVAPGGTAVFGTGASPNMAVDSLLSSLCGHSSARILATSKKIACDAFVMDPLNSPPTSGWPLRIIAKTKQKAAN